MTGTALRFALAGRGDADDIAALHADSWRRTYRGILRDGFLDDGVEEDRRVFWAARLALPSPDQWVLAARSEQVLHGFVCLMIGKDPEWGSLVDNLHVSAAARSTGLGTTLLARAAHRAHRPAARTGLYLWVYEGNHAARDFYARRGGREVEWIEEPVPGGGSARLARVAWPADQLRPLADRSA